MRERECVVHDGFGWRTERGGKARTGRIKVIEELGFGRGTNGNEEIEARIMDLHEFMCCCCCYCLYCTVVSELEIEESLDSASRIENGQVNHRAETQSKALVSISRPQLVSCRRLELKNK